MTTLVTPEFLDEEVRKFYDRIVEQENVATYTRDGLPLIDPLIWPLVRNMNMVGGIWTSQACQGHSVADLKRRQTWTEGKPQAVWCHVTFYYLEGRPWSPSWLVPLLPKWITFELIPDEALWELDQGIRYAKIGWAEPDDRNGLEMLTRTFGLITRGKWPAAVDVAVTKSADENPQWLPAP